MGGIPPEKRDGSLEHSKFKNLSPYELALNRRSVRSYNNSKPISPELISQIDAFIKDDRNILGPWGTKSTIYNVQAEGTSSLGTIVTVVDESAKFDFGFAAGNIMFYLSYLGLGTLAAGMVPKAKLEKHLPAGQKPWFIVAYGYPVDNIADQGGFVSKIISYGTRKPFFTFFNVFTKTEGSLKYEAKTIAKKEDIKNERLRRALHAVQWAPSAISRQPVRVFVDSLEEPTTVHFYSALGDDAMRQVDLGIALATFAFVFASPPAPFSDSTPFQIPSIEGKASKLPAESVPEMIFSGKDAVSDEERKVEAGKAKEKLTYCVTYIV